MEKKGYVAMLKDPRWQKKRLEILQRDNFTCRCCGSADKELQVYHLYYNPYQALVALCKDCHDYETFMKDEMFGACHDFCLMMGQLGLTKGVPYAVLSNFCSWFVGDMPPVIYDWISSLIETNEDLNNSINKRAWAEFKSKSLNSYGIKK